MRYLPLLAIAVALLAGCDRSPAPLRFEAFGIPSSIELDCRPCPEGAAEAARDDILYVAYITAAYQAGPTARINTLLAATGEFSANPSLVKPIRQSKELARRSQNRFNPAMGRLQQLWGAPKVSTAAPPADAALKGLLADPPTMAAITVRGVRVNNSHPALQLDFGAYASGYALENAALHLQSLGVHRGELQLGESRRLLDATATRGVRLLGAAANPIGRLRLAAGEALAVVANSPATPTIDPRSGQPVSHSRKAWVVGNESGEAAAMASALLVAGSSEWRELNGSMAIPAALLEDTDGHLFANAAMQQRLEDVMVVPFPPTAETTAP